MKQLIKTIFKITGGGIAFAFLFSLFNIFADLLSNCPDTLSIASLKILSSNLDLYNVVKENSFEYWRNWLTTKNWNNWEYLFFLFGASFVFALQLKPLFNLITQKHSRDLFIAAQTVLLVIFVLGISMEIKTELDIKKTYIEFCRSTRNKDYPLAYSYFSPEYRESRNLEKFTKKLEGFLDDSCMAGFDDNKFMGTIKLRFNKVLLYPYPWTDTSCALYLSGPEIILVRIDGKWYFTGEHSWYQD